MLGLPEVVFFPDFVLAMKLCTSWLPLCFVFTRNILGFPTERVILRKKMRRGKYKSILLLQAYHCLSLCSAAIVIVIALLPTFENNIIFRVIPLLRIYC